MPDCKNLLFGKFSKEIILKQHLTKKGVYNLKKNIIINIGAYNLKKILL